jgi:hypothetical protein
MDIGIFKASRARLMAWIVIPPMLIVGVGLSSYAWRQRTIWKLQQTQSLSDVLPLVIESKREAEKLIGDLGLDDKSAIGSEDQLISFLQEIAVKRGVTVESVMVVRREPARGENIPVLSASVKGAGAFSALQLYVNEVKSAQSLLYVNALSLTQPRERMLDAVFEANIVFDLMLIDEVLKTTGGSL